MAPPLGLQGGQWRQRVRESWHHARGSPAVGSRGDRLWEGPGLSPAVSQEAGWAPRLHAGGLAQPGDIAEEGILGQPDLGVNLWEPLWGWQDSGPSSRPAGGHSW